MSFSWQEWAAAACFLVSVWLLARNRPLGWWIGLVGSLLYIWIFSRPEVWLPGEILIQVYLVLTSLWGIWMWLKGGKDRHEKPVGRASPRLMAWTAVLGLVAWAALYWAFSSVEGRVPFWDSLTTVVSFIAQIYLVLRLVESWHLWIAVDVVYVPLYASRELYVTAGLYAVFLVLAWQGLVNFRREWEEGRAANTPASPGVAPWNHDVE